jgi:hypothetical protein
MPNRWVKSPYLDIFDIRIEAKALFHQSPFSKATLFFR